MVSEKRIIKSKLAQIEKKYCAKVAAMKACVELESGDASYIRNTALYKLIGKHVVSVVINHGKY